MKGRTRGLLACRIGSSILLFPSKFIIPCSIFDIVVLCLGRPPNHRDSKIISGLKIAGFAGGHSLPLCTSIRTVQQRVAPHAPGPRASCHRSIHQSA